MPSIKYLLTNPDHNKIAKKLIELTKSGALNWEVFVKTDHSLYFELNYKGSVYYSSRYKYLLMPEYTLKVNEYEANTKYTKELFEVICGSMDIGDDKVDAFNKAMKGLF